MNTQVPPPHVFPVCHFWLGHSLSAKQIYLEYVSWAMTLWHIAHPVHHWQSHTLFDWFLGKYFVHLHVQSVNLWNHTAPLCWYIYLTYRTLDFCFSLDNQLSHLSSIYGCKCFETCSVTGHGIESKSLTTLRVIGWMTNELRWNLIIFNEQHIATLCFTFRSSRARLLHSCWSFMLTITCLLRGEMDDVVESNDVLQYLHDLRCFNKLNNNSLTYQKNALHNSTVE